MSPVGASPPRSLFIFLILLVLAAVWLLVFDQEDDRDQPGPLFLTRAADIDSLLLRIEGRQLCLSVADDGAWHLSGDDYGDGDEIDSGRMDELLEVICRQTATEILPDSGPGTDRSQYGLEEGQRATLILVDGTGRESLSLGRSHPVGERVYAAGAGRSGVFLIASDLPYQLMQLPDRVILASLWQPFEISEIDTVSLGDRRGDHLLLRDGDDSWWLQPAPFAEAQVRARAADYDRHYSDRNRRVAETSQWRADEKKVRSLLLYLQRTDVSDLDGLELRSPTDTALVRVRVGAAEDQVRRSATFLAGLGPERDLVLRCGHGRPLFASGGAGKILREKAADLLAASLISRSAWHADSLRVRIPGRPVLLGIRREGRLRSLPGGPEVLYDFYNGLAKLVDAQEILEVLPPAAHSPFGPGLVSTISIVFNRTDSRISFQVGRLADGDLPAVWFPDTKKLLRVSEELIITMNNTNHLLESPAD